MVYLCARDHDPPLVDATFRSRVGLLVWANPAADFAWLLNERHGSWSHDLAATEHTTVCDGRSWDASRARQPRPPPRSTLDVGTLVWS